MGNGEVTVIGGARERMAMRTVDVIDRKRLGEELSRAEIEHMVLGYARGRIPDYQMSAWLMAICCRGMSRRETIDLTEAMVASGITLDLARVGMPVTDKHSSGGVGDKTTLLVAPLARACGVAVGKMSGRGLGFTGGTLDKLESIPGFRVDLTATQFVQQLEREGIVVSGQTPDLVPADRQMYALRDVTGTVASIPLIASSIMSKKLAVGAAGLALDVKVGTGAFLCRVEDARDLARLMVEIGVGAGKRVGVLLSPMDQPLGRAVGNALEVAEAIRVLRGDGPSDLVELSTALVGEMLYLVGRAATPRLGQELAAEALSSGRGLERFRRWVEVQGGDPRVVDHPELMGLAPLVVNVVAPRPGWVSRVEARGIAGACLLTGAGRVRKEDSVDHRVGVVLHARAGMEVREGDLLAEVHASDASAAREAAAEVLKAYAFGDAPPAESPVVLERIGPEDL